MEEKDKGGRPFGTFKGKEKKVKTSVGIEPRFRRAIVERYASFQEWFDSMIQREFQGEDIPALDDGATKDEADLETQTLAQAAGLSAPKTILAPPLKTEAEMKAIRQSFQSHHTGPAIRVPIKKLENLEILSVSLVPKEQLVDPHCVVQDSNEGIAIQGLIPVNNESGVKIGSANIDQSGNAQMVITDEPTIEQIQARPPATSIGYSVETPDDEPSQAERDALESVAKAFGPISGHPPGKPVDYVGTPEEHSFKDTDDELKALEGDDESDLNPLNQL